MFIFEYLQNKNKTLLPKTFEIKSTFIHKTIKSINSQFMQKTINVTILAKQK